MPAWLEIVPARLLKSQSLASDLILAKHSLRLMGSYPHRLLVIATALGQIKSSYPHSAANPNRIFQSLIALLAGLEVPILCTDTHELGEEAVASYLYQIHLCHWLEKNDHGRFLVDDDL